VENGDERIIYKIKRESCNAHTLTKTRLSQNPFRGTCPSELNLSQARSLQRSWAFSRPTRLGEKSLSPSPTRLNMRREAQP